MAPQTLVVTDLDGTLWDPQLDCHPRTVAALDELAARQIPVLVATGRRGNSAMPGLERLPRSYPAVLLNGAHGVDFTVEDNPVFHAETFSPDVGQSLIAAFDQCGLSPVLYVADGSVRGQAVPSSHPGHVRDVQPDWVLDTPAAVAASGDVLAMKMIGMPQEVLQGAFEAATDLGIDFAYAPDHLWGGWTLSMRPPGISKTNGIQAWLRYAQLAPTRIVALGDGDNDVEMLEFADLAISVETGHESAKAVADHIIEPPAAGGWATVLDLI